MQGLGFEVLAQVMESISPSHVLQLTTFNPNNNLPPDLWWLPEGLMIDHGPLVYQLPSIGALQQNQGLDPGRSLTCNFHKYSCLMHFRNISGGCAFHNRVKASSSAAWLLPKTLCMHSDDLLCNFTLCW